MDMFYIFEYLIFLLYGYGFLSFLVYIYHIKEITYYDLRKKLKLEGNLIEYGFSSQWSIQNPIQSFKILKI